MYNFLTGRIWPNLRLTFCSEQYFHVSIIFIIFTLCQCLKSLIYYPHLRSNTTWWNLSSTKFNNGTKMLKIYKIKEKKELELVRASVGASASSSQDKLVCLNNFILLYICFIHFSQVSIKFTLYGQWPKKNADKKFCMLQHHACLIYWGRNTESLVLLPSQSSVVCYHRQSWGQPLVC